MLPEPAAPPVVEMVVPTDTPTPTPIIVSAGDLPRITPTPVVTPSATIVEEYVEDHYDAKVTVYDNDTMIKLREDCTYVRDDGVQVIWSKQTVALTYTGTIRHEHSVKFEEILYNEQEANHGEIIKYYLYYFYDVKTGERGSRLVNSDGSFNRYSAHVFDDEAYNSSGRYGYDAGKSLLKYITFRSHRNDQLLINREDVIYYKQGEEIRLFDY